MKRYILPLAVLLVIGILTAGCGSTPTPTASPGGFITDYTSLIDGLREAGATAQPADEISQPFFSVQGRLIRIDGEEVQVFEYADAATADGEADLVSPDGSSVGTTMITWIATPHFYQEGKLIVLYVGDDTQVIGVLEATLGPQFAGGR